jgi:predicted nucleic acid-binding protein
LIVIDASALVELLLRGPAAPAIERRLSGPGVTLHAPHLVDVEVAHVIRRCALRRDISADRGFLALSRLADLRLTRYPLTQMLPRIWEMRENVSAYDAAYVALAEALDAPLLTRDLRLAAASGHRAKIEAL